MLRFDCLQAEFFPRMPTASRPNKLRLSRTEQNAQRSDELLEAAAEVFKEKGYEAVTIDDVAARAGYSRMPVYSLFGDKQGLFLELWRRSIEQITQRLLGQLKPGGALRRNLKLLAAAVAQGNAADDSRAGGSLFFVVQTIALSRPDLDDQLQTLSRKVVTDFADVLKNSTIEPGERLRGNAETAAAHLIAHINGLSTVRFQTGKNYAKARDLEAIFIAAAIDEAS